MSLGIDVFQNYVVFGQTDKIDFVGVAAVCTQHDVVKTFVFRSVCFEKVLAFPETSNILSNVAPQFCHHLIEFYWPTAPVVKKRTENIDYHIDLRLLRESGFLADVTSFFAKNQRQP